MIPSLLFWSAFVATSVPGVVVALRALPPIARLVDRGVKPWACDICSCFWITAGMVPWVAVAGHDPWLLFAAGPGYTGALAVLRFVQAPALPPPPEE